MYQLGFCEIKVDDNREELDCMMVSGQVASLIEGEKRDTIRPVPTPRMVYVYQGRVQGSNDPVGGQDEETRRKQVVYK